MSKEYLLSCGKFRQTFRSNHVDEITVTTLTHAAAQHQMHALDVQTSLLQGS